MVEQRPLKAMVGGSSPPGITHNKLTLHAPCGILKKSMKSISLLLVFIFLTPVALAVSVFSLVMVSSHAGVSEKQVLATHIGANIFAALPDEPPSIETIVGSKDARAVLVRNYLERYDSPLAAHAEYIIKMADEYEIDFRLITAIAQQESNLCKIIPEGTFNCWGWGIHSQGTLGFTSYEEGIRTVTRGLKKDYINEGLIAPEQIMQKYTPLSNGSWAFGVRLFMEEMR